MAKAKDHTSRTDAQHAVPKRQGRMRIGSWADAPSTPKAAKARVMRFGSVILEQEPVGRVDVERNVERGRSAMNSMGAALSAPGVRLDVVAGVPLYHADPQRPDRIVRVLDGHSQSGLLVNGEFKAV